MDYVKIPLSRIGAMIGPKGETRKKIEKMSGCEISIDSKEGIIEIKSKNNNDPLKNLQLISTAKAIGRGFTPDKAIQLLEMEYYLEVVDQRLRWKIKEKISNNKGQNNWKSWKD